MALKKAPFGRGETNKNTAIMFSINYVDTYNIIEIVWRLCMYKMPYSLVSWLDHTPLSLHWDAKVILYIDWYNCTLQGCFHYLWTICNCRLLARGKWYTNIFASEQWKVQNIDHIGKTFIILPHFLPYYVLYIQYIYIYCNCV